MNRTSLFNRLAKWMARAAGHPAGFALAVLVIVAWVATGPVFHFTDTWQLVINTGTTIITFLMVFLIQNTQNRDTEALQIKLDELLRSVDTAHNTMIDLEELDDEQLEAIRKDYLKLARQARTKKKHGKDDRVILEVQEQGENTKTVKKKSAGK